MLEDFENVQEERITKVQRWLDLIAYLVARHLPVAVDELMERLPAYAQDWMDGDDTARESVRRKFERDKDELRTFGIPIETVPFSMGFAGETTEGYRIQRRDFYLPYLKLLGEAGVGGDGRAADGVAKSGGIARLPTPAGSGPEEGAGAIPGTDTVEIPRDEATKALRGLQALADLPAFPLAGAARSAYRKLTFDLDPQLTAREGGDRAYERDAPDGPGGEAGRAETGGESHPSGPAAASPESGRNRRILFAPPPEMVKAKAHLDVLSPALMARKRVSFRYHGMGRDEVSDRRVHPWGLLFQHSRWYLVGWDLDRDAERMFRVDRMAEVEANSRKPNTPDYELPEEPILEKYRNREAWELGEPDETIQARARFSFPTSLWAERNRYGTLVEEGSDGDAIREFELREPHAFLRWILALEGEADIESPPELRDDLRTMAREVAALYGAARSGTVSAEEANGGNEVVRAPEEGPGEDGNG